MQYYNLKLIVMPKTEINSNSAYEKISKLIAKAMLQYDDLKELHEKNEYKNYVFCNLYPVEKDGVYKTDKLYTFDIRFIDLKMAMKIKQKIEKVDSDFKIIMTNIQTNTQRKITKLITLTPSIITTETGSYKISEDMEFVKKRMLDNIQKKYNNIFDTDIKEDFIKNVKQTNLKPIKIPYKNINLLGNKFEIEVKEDPISQNLAYLALSIGLLEKNALGFGFCRAI